MADESLQRLEHILAWFLFAAMMTGPILGATFVVSADLPPVANAGPDQNVNVGGIVMFNASGTTDDIDTLASMNYTWSFTYGGSARNLWGVTAEFQFSEIGSYIVTLTVIDSGGLSGTDVLLVNVNGPPTANAGPDIDAVAGEPMTFDGSASTDDADTSALNFTWNGTVVGSSVILYTMQPSYTFDSAGTYTFTLTVRDAGGLTSNDTVTVVVAAANAPPVAHAGSDKTAKTGDIVLFDGSTSTDDNGTSGLNYTWQFLYNGEVMRIYGPQPTFIFKVAGTYNVTLIVRDTEGLTSTDSVSVAVEKTSKSFVATYWWSLAVIVIAVIGLILLMIMRRRGSVATSDETAEHAEDKRPRSKVVPPPDEEEL